MGNGFESFGVAHADTAPEFDAALNPPRAVYAA